jgi:hypothetical protein
MHSLYRWRTLLTVWNIYPLHSLDTKYHFFFFIIKEEFVHKSWIFLHSNTDCSVNSLRYVTKSRPCKRRKLSIDRLPHCVRTEETDYRSVVLQSDHVPCKRELPLRSVVAVVKVLWPFVQKFLKHPSPKLRYFLWHFQQIAVWSIAAQKHLNGACS